MSNFDDYTPHIEVGEYTEDAVESTSASSSQDSPQEEKSSRGGRRETRSKKSQKKKTETKPESAGFVASIKTLADKQTLRMLLGLFLGFVGVYLTVAFISYMTTCIADQSMVYHTAMGNTEKVHNIAGEGGARVSSALINDWFGLGSMVIIFWLAAMSMKLLGVKLRFKSVNFTIKCLIALIAVSLIIGLVTIGLDTTVNWGGVHGRFVNEQVIHFLGMVGAVILCCFVLAVFVMICMRDVVKWILKLRREHVARKAAEAAERERLERERLEREEMNKREIHESAEVTVEEEPEDPGHVTFGEAESRVADIPVEEYGIDEVAEYDLGSEDQVPESLLHIVDETSPAAEAAADVPSGTPGDAASQGQSDSGVTVQEMTVNVNHIGKSEAKQRKPEGCPGNKPYKFPPYDLMRAVDVQVKVDRDEQLENEERIRKTLLDFGINIVSINATIGPTVTLYEIVPDYGVKISKIRNLVDDIALRIAATGVRIIAPIPGKGTVGIEVANKEPQTVSMRTIIESNDYQEKSKKYKLPIAIGCTISNHVYITDLAKMPHLLVAGATGQGKSVGLNAIITSLLYSKSPDELKFVMIDPKMVEFSFYEKIEQFYLAKLPGDEDPIITDMNKVVATLSSLCVEMDSRYQLLRKAHARNIEEYNPKYVNGDISPDNGHRFMPYIVVVVDEFSDLIMTAGKEVEMPIARLAQKARAVGMHVIIATQRPSTNVITGIIKANFPARIAFKVGSGVDSKTILDCTGAQQLIGRGDMLVSHNSELVRVQCAFMDTPEVEDVCDYIARQAYPRGVYELPEPVIGGDDDADSGRGGGTYGDRDPLFDEVARAVVMSNSASTSSLQRRYSIGYNRAGKIMDQLEAAGIVGPSRDGKPRSVLVDAVTLESML